MDIEELLERTAITDALVRYTLAVDAASWDDLDTVFTPDARIDYTASGGIEAALPETKAWLAENLFAFATRTMHTLGQVAVTFDVERLRADVSAYFHNPMVIRDGRAGVGGERVVEVGGIYHHRFVRTDLGWRSRALREDVVWTRGF